jgi:hypothetical protein
LLLFWRKSRGLTPDAPRTGQKRGLAITLARAIIASPHSHEELLGIAARRDCPFHPGCNFFRNRIRTRLCCSDPHLAVDSRWLLRCPVQSGPSSSAPFRALRPPSGVCSAGDVTTSAVSSYLAISPLPASKTDRRYVFCCTFPEITFGGRYPPLRPAESGLSSTRGRDRSWVAVVALAIDRLLAPDRPGQMLGQRQDPKGPCVQPPDTGEQRYCYPV